MFARPFAPALPGGPSRGSLLFKRRRRDSLRWALIGAEVEGRRRREQEFAKSLRSTETQTRIPRGRLSGSFWSHRRSGGSSELRSRGRIRAPWQHASSFECVWQREIHNTHIAARLQIGRVRVDGGRGTPVNTAELTHLQRHTWIKFQNFFEC